MRTLLGGLLLATLAAATAASAASDVVVEYERPPPTFGAAPQETLNRHGERIRIGSRTVRSDGVALTNAEFTAPGQAVRFRVGWYADGRLAYLGLMDDPLTAPPPNARRMRTGETQRLLGETCRVWQVANRTPYGFDFVQSGCATADGVELWRRQAKIDYIAARRVVRRPVPAADVRVPVEVLDLAAWVGPDGLQRTSAPAISDYEVVFETPGPSIRRRIARRSGDWTYEREDRYDGTVTVQIANRTRGLTLYYTRQHDGQRQVNVSRLATLANAVDEMPPVRLADRPDETILGERCRWWDLMPTTADAGLHVCRTADGVVLKRDEIVRADVRTLTAARFRRGLQPTSAILPDAEIVSPAAWGF